ncbi:RNA polymerase sigma factor [Novipirellula artificiosorum]|uniref:ECF RNA polymerase sigma factor SigW n=1 Tax=Novipirellula artificiosorum TaxID=2528016 RepID=A0A5C6DSZ8_9BACT|nr:RNA polymerase sigma factor [Novipirellula artificiosorum]TWU38621.1 ECF RNA polymerase sigma factor SigW [Novipirellula artificiosorum]
MTEQDESPLTANDELVVAARTDRDAFGEIYEAYYDRILGFCLKRLFDRSIAEDVCGEVFLYVAKHMHAFRGTTEQDFRRWVYRIATTETNAIIRRNKRRQELWDDALLTNRISTQGSHNDETSTEQPDWTTVYQAIRQLNQRQKMVVTLRLFDELPYEDIAEILKIRQATARVAYSRAIERLRQLLVSDSPELDETKVR